MEMLDKNLKVVLGQLIRVKNLNKRKFENDAYVALQVEDENGENERCILFSEIEISDMEKLTAKILEETLVTGRIYKFYINNRETNIVKVINMMGDFRILRISKSQMARAEHRAERNKEDLTSKGFFTDLFD